MRDARDAAQLYEQIMHVKHVHGCSVTEAADLVETMRPGSKSPLDSRAGSHREATGTPAAPPVTPPDWAAQNGAPERGD